MTITRITLEIELFTALNCFAGAVKTKKHYGSSISIRVSGSGKLIRYLSVINPTQHYLLENSLSLDLRRYVQLCERIVRYNYY